MEGENGRSPGHGDPSKSDEEGGGRPSRRSRTGTNDDEDRGEGPEAGENVSGGDVEGPRGVKNFSGRHRQRARFGAGRAFSSGPESDKGRERDWFVGGRRERSS